MTDHRSNERSLERSQAQLDALLNRGVQADKRATKPQITIPAQPMGAPPASGAIQVPQRTIPTLIRLTVRFTHAESQLIEQIRMAARTMGYRISDTAAFRLALKSFDPARLTAQQLAEVTYPSRKKSQLIG